MKTIKTTNAVRENAESLVWMTAEQAAELRRKNAVRDLMGGDVRNHSGARSKVHRSGKDYSRFGRREKNAVMRGDW